MCMFNFESKCSVNIKGAFLCSNEAANRLKQGGGGRIILLTSSMTRGLKPGFGAYAASKQLWKRWSRFLRKSSKEQGSLQTAQLRDPSPLRCSLKERARRLLEKIAAENPFGRVGEVKDVVPLVGFLASDGRERINGQIIAVSGGYV
ncbi:NAD(P)-binding Rossmann-fold superfamily protein [Raphanus sativus]|nr:NAD(P)-binding Rossmann-fold superfamily protein [Raphanus sativus]